MGFIRTIIFVGVSVLFYHMIKDRFAKLDYTGKKTDKVGETPGFLAFALFLVLVLGTLFYGERMPGAMFERGEYDAMMYVFLFPGNQLIRCQRLPALISRDHNGEYVIHYVETPGGRKITFGVSPAIVELDRIVEVYGDSRTWMVMLTDQRVRGASVPVVREAPW